MSGPAAWFAALAADPAPSVSPPEPVTRPGVLLHYSEDPSISTFAPHVPRSNPTAAAAVWAIDPGHAPLYWFPRDCPRVAVWANTAEQRVRLATRFQTSTDRLQVVPVGWRDEMRACRLFEYRFDPEPFAPWPDAEGQWVTHEPVTASAVEPVGDLLARHTAHHVELRFVEDLAAVREAVMASELPFSIVRFSTSSA